jgi:hypothetical protein
VDQLLSPMVYGVRPVIALAMPPILVSPPLFAFLLKEKGSDQMERASMGIGDGKARTFLQVTIPTKLHLLFMMHPPLPLLQVGGTILN